MEAATAAASLAALSSAQQLECLAVEGPAERGGLTQLAVVQWAIQHASVRRLAITNGEHESLEHQNRYFWPQLDAALACLPVRPTLQIERGNALLHELAGLEEVETDVLSHDVDYAF